MRRLNFQLCSTFSVIALVACASVDTHGVAQRITRPEIGALTVREVGSPLFETIIARTEDGITFAPGTRIRYGLAPLVVEPTGPFGATSRGTYCGPVEQVTGISGVLRYKAPPEMCVTDKQLKDQNLSFERGPVTRKDPSNFQQQLLYEGKVGRELHLSYREFRGDFARPAFTQDLSFDLGEGDVVGAKGARIEVLSATNTEIQYKVLQPFAP